MKKLILAAAVLALLTACGPGKPANHDEGPAQGQDNTDPGN